MCNITQSHKTNFTAHVMDGDYAINVIHFVPVPVLFIMFFYSLIFMQVMSQGRNYKGMVGAFYTPVWGIYATL